MCGAGASPAETIFSTTAPCASRRTATRAAGTVVNLFHGECRGPIRGFVDRDGRANCGLLVVRHHAGRTLLQRLRQSTAAGPGGLLHLLRTAAEIERGYPSTGAGIL